MTYVVKHSIHAYVVHPHASERVWRQLLYVVAKRRVDTWATCALAPEDSWRGDLGILMAAFPTWATGACISRGSFERIAGPNAGRDCETAPGPLRDPKATWSLVGVTEITDIEHMHVAASRDHKT